MRITNYRYHGNQRKYIPRFVERHIPKKYRRACLDNQHYALVFFALFAILFTACIFFSSSAAREDRFQELITWVNKNGGKIQDIELKNNDKGNFRCNEYPANFEQRPFDPKLSKYRRTFRKCVFFYRVL